MAVKRGKTIPFFVVPAIVIALFVTAIAALPSLESSGTLVSSTTLALQDPSSNSLSTPASATTSASYSSFRESQNRTSNYLITTSSTAAASSVLLAEVTTPSSLISEEISTESLSEYPITCSVTGINGAVETFCEMGTSDNEGGLSRIASFALSISGNSTDRNWSFSLGIPKGLEDGNLSWIFGDGSNTTSASNRTVVHDYNESGVYAAKLWFTISSLPNSSISWKIYVKDTFFLSTLVNANLNSTVLLDNQDGSAICQKLFRGIEGTGGWNSSSGTCALSGSPLASPTFLVTSQFTLIVGEGTTLVLSDSGSGFANYGTIVNNGTLIIQNTFDDFGKIINHGIIINNSTDFQLTSWDNSNETGTIEYYGTFYNAPNSTFANGGLVENNGTIDNQNAASIYNNLANTSLIVNYGEFNNYGSLHNREVIANDGGILNQGTIVMICDGVITGNPVYGEPPENQGC